MICSIHERDFVALFAIISVIVSQPSRTHAENAYGDHGVIITATPTNIDTFQQVVAIPATPRDIANYTSRTYPGFRFQSLQRLYLACDVDYNRNELYLYDMVNKDITVGTNFNTSMFKDEMEWTRVHYVSKEVARVAVDWVSHNIYWTDPLMGWIAMQPGGVVNDSTMYKVILNDTIHLPRGLAVDPLAGYIFWTDYGPTSKIERASLTGANRRMLQVASTKVPSSIVADIASQRIFWTDSYFINSADYDGSNRRQIVSYSQANFLDISIYQDTLMVTDQSLYRVLFYDTSTGAVAAPAVSSANDKYIGVCMYHGDNQPPSPAGDLCSGYGCQDICVMEPTSTGVMPTCLCREGFIQDPNDPKKCEEAGGQYHRAIILTASNQKKLCKLDIHILTDHSTHTPTCFYEHPPSLNETMTHIDLNMNTREVYFATKNKIYSVPIDQNKTVSARQLTSIVEDRTIMGLSFDWVNGYIYWTESMDGDGGSINMLDPVTLNSIRLSSAAQDPRDITVLPHEGKMLWISVNRSQIDILVSALGASIDMAEPYSRNWGSPRRMILDQKYHRVMVLDKDGVYSFNYDGYLQILDSFFSGENDNFMDMALYQEMTSNVKSITFCERRGGNISFDEINPSRITEQILVLDISADGVYTLKSADMQATTFTLSFTSVGKVEGLGDVFNIRILDATTLQPSYKSPCRQRLDNDTACDHVCVPTENTSMCYCETGFILAANGFTCEQAATPVTDNFILVTEMYHNKIYQIDLNNPETVIGIEVVEDVGRLGGIRYDYQRDTVIYSSRGLGEIREVALNGSSSQMVTDVGSLAAEPDFLAMDPTNGDIYYSAVSNYADEFQDSFIGVMSTDGYDTILVYEGHSPRGLVLHPELGLMFWTDHGVWPMLQRANMDGSGMTVLVDEEIQWPNGLTISYKTPANESLLYWADGYYDAIYSCDINGGKRTKIYVDPKSHMMDIAYLDGFLYYTSWDYNYITKLSLENTSDVTRIGPPAGIGRLHALDVYSSAHVATIPLNAACATNKGGCSHFCLPKVDGGHTCGCHFPFGTLADGRTCENVPRCPAYLPNGKVSEDDTCLRLEGNVCQFACYDRFKTSVANLTCEEGTTWDNRTPCEDLLCPASIPNAFLAAGCDRLIDSDCIQYICAAGYEKNTDFTELVCQDDATWKADINTLCIAKCPTVNVDVEMAELTSSCERTVNETCPFLCKERYRYATSARTINCNEGASVPQWSPPTHGLCEEIKCSPVIKDGLVNASRCSMLPNARCPYSCDDMYEANSDVMTITCTATGVWSHVATNDTLCIAIPPASQASKNEDAVKVGVGIGVGLGILIIVIVIVVLLFRTGKLGSPKPKPDTSAAHSVAFENPRYQESSLGASGGGQTNSEFAYATLEEDRIEMKDDLAKRTPAAAKNNVYDNMQ